MTTDGKDTFTGSGSADSVSYARSTAAGVTVDLGTPANNRGWAADDTLTGIQNIAGSINNDVLTGNGQPNSLQGSDGDDMLYGREGDDTLSGGRGSDILHGGEGDDTLFGGPQGDTLNGGVGTNDDYIFQSGHGADSIENDADGGNLFFRAAASFGDFTIGRDASNDNVKITVGEDSLEFIPAAYADGRYTLYHGENDEILGTLIVGEDGTFTGGRERNVIIGTAQGETINGGAGDDTIDGGAGNDTYIFNVGDGADTIYDQVESTGTSIISLRFEGSQYEVADFTEANARFNKEGDDLVITIDKDNTDSITDKVTINDAFDTDDNLLYTINVGYGAEGSFTQVAAADAYWNSLGAA